METCIDTGKHPSVIVYWRLWACETRYDPAEYIGRAQCQECGAWMDPADVPAEAERREVEE